MDIDTKKLQIGYDLIHSYFKTTTESFDFLEWDGISLQVWKDNDVIEVYGLKGLKIILNTTAI